MQTIPVILFGVGGVGRALLRQTVLPMAARVLAGLATLLGDWLGPVTLAVDEDRLSELAEDRARIWAQVSAADFLSRAEKRVQLGYPATSTGSGQAEEGE